jgi:hypothetical protein
MTSPCSAPDGLAEQSLDEYAVFPLSIEFSVATLHTDLVEPGSQVGGATRKVLGEDTRGELVELCSRAPA